MQLLHLQVIQLPVQSGDQGVVQIGPSGLQPPATRFIIDAPVKLSSQVVVVRTGESRWHDISVKYFFKFCPLLSTNRSFSLLGEGPVILPPIMKVVNHILVPSSCPQYHSSFNCAPLQENPHYKQYKALKKYLISLKTVMQSLTLAQQEEHEDLMDTSSLSVEDIKIKKEQERANCYGFDVRLLILNLIFVFTVLHPCGTST